MQDRWSYHSRLDADLRVLRLIFRLFQLSALWVQQAPRRRDLKER
jgi:hypothetical protein